MSRMPSPPPGRTPEAATFTLSDADIVSQRAVPRPRLPGVLGIGAAALAFGNGGGAVASDHDGPADPARPARRAVARPMPDGDG